MNKVKHFVEISRKDFNQQKELKLEIESFALRKQLAKELMDIYKEERIIYTDFSKGSNTFTVKKWKQNGPANNNSAMNSLINSKFASNDDGVLSKG